MKTLLNYLVTHYDLVVGSIAALYEIIVRIVPTAKSWTIVRLIIWVLQNIDKLQIVKK